MPEPEPEVEPAGENQKSATPSAIWRSGAFAGEFCDAFIKDTDLEGGHSGPAIQQLLPIIRDALSKRLGDCCHLNEGDRQVALKVADDLEMAAVVEEAKNGARSNEGFAEFLKGFIGRLRALQPRRSKSSLGLHLACSP